MIARHRVYELIVSTTTRKNVPVHVEGRYNTVAFTGIVGDCDSAASAYLASLFDPAGVTVEECRLVADVGEEVPPLGSGAINAARATLDAAMRDRREAREALARAEVAVEAALFHAARLLDARDQ